MMDGFKWTQMSFILVLVLQLAAGNTPSSLYHVRAGDDAALACGNVIRDRSSCDSTTWTWATSTTPAVELIRLGQIVENSGFQSDRLSVTADCSLVIKKVRKEDAGYLLCKQFRSGTQRPPDAQVYLSVVSMTEQKKKDDEVTLNCSVSAFNGCRQKVKWQFEGKDVKQQQGVSTSSSPCSVSLTVPSYHLVYTSRHQSLECEVSDGDRGQLFLFRLQASEENPCEVTTESTTSTRPTEKNKTTTDATESGVNDSSKLKAQWRLIIVSVGLSALMLTVVTVNVWARTKGKQTRVDDNMVIEDHDGDDDAVNYENVRPSAV